MDNNTAPFPLLLTSRDPFEGQPPVPVIREIWYEGELFLGFVSLLLAMVIFLFFYRYAIKRLLRHATTPIRRMGIIAIFFSALIYLATAAHWNIKKETFIAHEHKLVDKTPKRYEKDGAYWDTDREGYHLYDINCVTQANKKKNIGTLGWSLSPPQECQIDFIRYDFIYENKWYVTIGDYLKELFVGKKWRIGRYFYWNILAIVLFVNGLMMSLGLIERMLIWIRHGK